MTRVPLTVLFALVAAVAHAAPPWAVAAALDDARKLPPDTAKYTRYLDLSHLTGDPESYAVYLTDLRFHLNAISRESEFGQPKVIADGAMLRIDLREYQIDTEVYGRLNALVAKEPYFHSITDMPKADAYGRPTAEKERISIAAPWLPGAEVYPPTGVVKELQERTYSQVPVVRGDWFFATTCLSRNRGDFKNGKGVSYYDFLKIRTRDDYFKLIGLNEKDARAFQSEIGAVVKESGVATQPRQIVRLGARDSGAWFTLDFFDESKDRKSALRLLDRDFGLKHDAEEHFGMLPNGLPVVIACNAKGELQDYAPAEIGSNDVATGRDKRIHVAMACFACHKVDFLQPIADEVRPTFEVDPTRKKDGQELRSPVFEEQLKLRRIFLKDIDERLADDRVRYARATVRACGKEPTVLSGMYLRGYEQYYAPVTSAKAAAELGVTEQVLTTKLRSYVADKQKGNAIYDNSLAPLVRGRSLPRDTFEELFGLLMGIANGPN